MEESTRVKLVVVGDGTVGKTCILVSYAKNQFPTQYNPTVFDNLTTTMRVEGRLINLGLWDTAGQEQYSTLRQLAYSNTDVFFIVFSVVQLDSFTNARKKWYPEISQCVPNSTIVFVGNKIDLRGGKNIGESVSYEKAKNLIDSECHCSYYECSALTQSGLKEVFESAAAIAIAKKRGKLPHQPPRRPKKAQSSCVLI